jgi:hypothetical protein
VTELVRSNVNRLRAEQPMSLGWSARSSSLACSRVPWPGGGACARRSARRCRSRHRLFQTAVCDCPSARSSSCWPRNARGSAHDTAPESASCALLAGASLQCGSAGIGDPYTSHIDTPLASAHPLTLRSCSSRRDQPRDKRGGEAVREGSRCCTRRQTWPASHGRAPRRCEQNSTRT